MFPELRNNQQEKPEEYYWRLTTKQNQSVMIPPSAVAIVRRRMEAREPINTTSLTVPYSEIKSFERTARKATSIPLLEEVAQAFDEPILIDQDDGTVAVKARWVKKEVTNAEYGGYYAKHPSYQKIDGSGDGLVTVAFVVAVHNIDTNSVSYCTAEEVRELTK